MSKLLLALVPAARPEPLAVFPADATVMMFRANTIKGIGTITINNNKNQQIGQVKTSKYISLAGKQASSVNDKNTTNKR